MKRLLLITALVLLMAVGFVYAANISRVVDPQNQKEIWTTQVYNNAGKALTVGEVVVWEISASTGDNDNYVTVTTTADTAIVAGIVYPAGIADGENGTIAIYGMVDTYCVSACVVNDILCTSTITYQTDDCTSDYYGFALCQEATGAAGLAKCFINTSK